MGVRWYHRTNERHRKDSATKKIERKKKKKNEAIGAVLDIFKHAAVN